MAEHLVVAPTGVLAPHLENGLIDVIPTGHYAAI